MDAFRPARHLSNNTLRQAFRAFLVPIVAEKYHLIAVRCLWRVEKNEFHRAHALISGKRRQLELLLQRTSTVKIVISAITGQEEGTKKHKKPTKKAKGDKNLESMPAERIVMKEIVVKKVVMMVMAMRKTMTILTCSQSLTVHLVKTHVDRNRYIRESAFG